MFAQLKRKSKKVDQRKNRFDHELQYNRGRLQSQCSQ